MHADADTGEAAWDAHCVTPEDLAHLRRARDQMDRDYARPLDVPALARTALMSPAHFARQFRAAYGETPYGYLSPAGSSGRWRCCVGATCR